MVVIALLGHVSLKGIGRIGKVDAQESVRVVDISRLHLAQLRNGVAEPKASSID